MEAARAHAIGHAQRRVVIHVPAEIALEPVPAAAQDAREAVQEVAVFYAQVDAKGPARQAAKTIVSQGVRVTVPELAETDARISAPDVKEHVPVLAKEPAQVDVMVSARELVKALALGDVPPAALAAQVAAVRAPVIAAEAARIAVPDAAIRAPIAAPLLARTAAAAVARESVRRHALEPARIPVRDTAKGPAVATAKEAVRIIVRHSVP